MVFKRKREDNKAEHTFIQSHRGLTGSYQAASLTKAYRGKLVGGGGEGKEHHGPTGKDRAVSTFLKETDLAGLKVCSVNSSPSIVSVQSERGASCNSKLSHQSTPGPALKISTKTTG